MSNNYVFFCMFDLSLDTQTIKKFLEATKVKTNRDFVKESLRMKDDDGQNLLFCLTHSVKFSSESFQQVIQILQIYFDTDEIFELVEERDNNKFNIMHKCVVYKRARLLENVWNSLEILYKSSKNSERFKKLLSQKSGSGQNILHIATRIDEVFHETLWKLLLNTFENREELKNLIMQRSDYCVCYVHFLSIFDTPEIIDRTFRKLRDSFSSDQCEEILKINSSRGENMLQYAINESADIKRHQILWKNFLNTFKSKEELLKVIKNVDQDNLNVLECIVYSSTAEVLDIIIKTLDESILKNDIKNLLAELGFCNGNIIHTATIHNKSLELHKKLWEIIQKYFISPEILGKIHHYDRDGDNFLHNAVFWNKKEIVEFTWNQIKKFIKTKKEQSKYLKRKGHRSQNLLQMSSENKSKDQEVRTWVENLTSEYEIVFD